MTMLEHEQSSANFGRHDSVSSFIHLENEFKGDLKSSTAKSVEEPLINNQTPLHSLEKLLGDPAHAVKVRRTMLDGRISGSIDDAVHGISFESYDYSHMHGNCCENVVGYVPIPLGVAGPLRINGELVWLPMATTEGALVASVNRGCSALNAGGGVRAVILDDGITRGATVRFSSLIRASEAKAALESDSGFSKVKAAFDSTSRFARLQSLKIGLAGSDLYIRFKATTGDAMGMNMISIGVEKALQAFRDDSDSQLPGFSDMQIVSLSGNYCTDKKATAMNWIEGRGKSSAAQAVVPAAVVEKKLKTTVDALVELNTSKNLVGSALAGALGGFNAHAGNMVAAVFLATGQDPAQVTESSSCITTMRKTDTGDLEISVMMPSIEVGTVGGGTKLPAQASVLDMVGAKGANASAPGANASRLAQIVASAVLASELNLCSVLVSNELVSAHVQHNRSVKK